MPSENQFFFEYDCTITVTQPLQFIEYELKMRCNNIEYEFHSDHINTDRPYITDSFTFTKFIPSNNRCANLRGVLTFITDNGIFEEVEFPLTFFKVEIEDG